MINKLVNKLVCIFLMIFSLESVSGVRPANTRVIMNMEGEHSVDILNDSNEEYLVQAWLENELGQSKELPVVLTPPVFKLGGKEKGFVRLLPLVDKLAQDRENIFYLLVQEIPKRSTSDSNKLKIAVRSKIKVFVRPEGLDSAGLVEASKKIKWELTSEGNKSYLKASNDSGYYFSLGTLKLSNKSKTKILEDNFRMVPPFGEQRYEVPQDFNTESLSLKFGIINDYGAISEIQTIKF